MDQALVNCIWRWRVRIRESTPGPNWEALKWNSSTHSGTDETKVSDNTITEQFLLDKFNAKLV